MTSIIIYREQMSEDFARNEKQNYLRENIIEKGYKPEKFVEYMQALRGILLFVGLPSVAHHILTPLFLLENGDNIDLWTIDELKDIVDRFVEKNPLQPEKPQPEEEQSTTAANSEPTPAGTTAAQPSVVMTVKPLYLLKENSMEHQHCYHHK